MATLAATVLVRHPHERGARWRSIQTPRGFICGRCCRGRLTRAGAEGFCRVCRAVVAEVRIFKDGLLTSEWKIKWPRPHRSS